MRLMCLSPGHWASPDYRFHFKKRERRTWEASDLVILKQNLSTLRDCRVWAERRRSEGLRRVAEMLAPSLRAALRRKLREIEAGGVLDLRDALSQYALLAYFIDIPTDPAVPVRLNELGREMLADLEAPDA